MRPIEHAGEGNTRREPTDILVERFLKIPGVEGEQLEFKSKEKVESNDGRREVVQTLVGMANRWGGTIIIGVSEEGDARIESFSEDSEVKRDLTNLVRDNTEPDLSTDVDIGFDHVGNGKHVLRIDIEQTDYELYKFNKREADGYIPYWRVEDSTREMTPEDSIEFAESRRHNPNPIGHAQTETVESLPRSSPTITEVQSPDHRLVTESDEGVQPVFGGELLSRNKPLVFELDTQLRIETVEEVDDLLERAVEYLSVNPNSVAYSFHQGIRAWCGRGADRLIGDFEQIDSVVEQMLGGHPRNVDDEITHLDDIRATISIVADCYLGLFHAELYWKYSRVDKAQAGVRLENIPFDDEFLHEFFRKYRSSPTVYDQQRNAENHFVLLSDFELENLISLDFWQESQFTSYVVADNPFYGQRTEIQRQAEKPLPELELKKFCSIERIPFRISDGTTNPERKDFQMEKVTVWPTDYLWSPFYIEAECSRYSA